MHSSEATKIVTTGIRDFQLALRIQLQLLAHVLDDLALRDEDIGHRLKCCFSIHSADFLVVLDDIAENISFILGIVSYFVLFDLPLVVEALVHRDVKQQLFGSQVPCFLEGEVWLINEAAYDTQIAKLSKWIRFKLVKFTFWHAFREDLASETTDLSELLV